MAELSARTELATHDSHTRERGAKNGCANGTTESAPHDGDSNIVQCQDDFLLIFATARFSKHLFNFLDLTSLLKVSCACRLWQALATSQFSTYHANHTEALKWLRGKATVYSVSMPAPMHSEPQRTVVKRSIHFYTRLSVLHLHKLLSGRTLHDWAILVAEQGDVEALSVLMKHQHWSEERKTELLYTAAHCGRKHVAKTLVQGHGVPHAEVWKNAVRRQKRAL